MKPPIDRARAYLAKLPPAISGSGGHSATFRAACECVRFGLADLDAMACLREFNQRCRPLWTEKELAHKLADARRVVSGQVERSFHRQRRVEGGAHESKSYTFTKL